MPKENMKRKTREEIQAWVADKKRKKGEKITIADEDSGFSSVNRIGKMVTKL